MALVKALAEKSIERIGTYQNIPDIVLVSAQHDRGMYLFHDGVIDRVNRGSITGLWVENGKLFFAYVAHDHARIGQLDQSGEIKYRVNTEVGDIHDIRYFNGKFYAVSTVSNEICVMSEDGRLTERIRFPGAGDAWHLNCLDNWNGKLVVSAFGEFDWHRQWKGNYKGSGIVADVESREILWKGLSQPHSPKILPDGTKCVCDSYAKKLLVDRNGEVKEVEFPGKYPRGLSFGEQNLYVGLSQSRRVDMLKAEEAKAGMAVVDRQTLEVKQFIPLPVVEIYDVLVLPG
ncbi:MAG TPA: DUF4915 domain-containing protein [Drouetiella sp.]